MIKLYISCRILHLFSYLVFYLCKSFRFLFSCKTNCNIIFIYLITNSQRRSYQFSHLCRCDNIFDARNIELFMREEFVEGHCSYTFGGLHSIKWSAPGFTTSACIFDKNHIKGVQIQVSMI